MPSHATTNGGDERKRRQVGIIGNGQARLECQLGNKMRGPHAGTKDAGCGGHQSEAPLPSRFPRSDKEIYRSEAPKNANQSGQHHKPDVVSLRDTAVKDFEHSIISGPHQ